MFPPDEGKIIIAILELNEKMGFIENRFIDKVRSALTDTAT
jgi:hypothetical protein